VGERERSWRVVSSRPSLRFKGLLSDVRAISRIQGSFPRCKGLLLDIRVGGCKGRLVKAFSPIQESSLRFKGHLPDLRVVLLLDVRVFSQM